MKAYPPSVYVEWFTQLFFGISLLMLYGAGIFFTGLFFWICLTEPFFAYFFTFMAAIFIVGNRICNSDKKDNGSAEKESKLE